MVLFNSYAKLTKGNSSSPADRHSAAVLRGHAWEQGPCQGHLSDHTAGRPTVYLRKCWDYGRSVMKVVICIVVR